MAMQAGGGSGGLQSEINVTPMVDIMLVLLIIFMVVTPFLQQGITVALPKNMNNPDVDPNIIKESSIVISIPNDGEYYLGKQRVAERAVDGQSRDDAARRSRTSRIGSSTSRVASASATATWSTSSMRSASWESIRSDWWLTRRRRAAQLPLPRLLRKRDLERGETSDVDG